MNAQLKPIATFCVERPKFDNTQVKHTCLWVAANIEKLRAYYADLGRSMADDNDDQLTGFAKAQAFSAFCQVQHDRETGRF